MEEVTSKQLEAILQERRQITIVFIHTPFCGTCIMAKKMVEIASTTFESLPIYALNLNLSPSFAQTWQVKSVPGLFIFQKGFGVERVYALRSISYIHNVIKPYAAVYSSQAREMKGDND